jgi:hypothetical protein
VFSPLRIMQTGSEKPTQPSLGVKRQGREADHSPTSSAEA